MIGKTVLHYRIIEKLGEGGMGVVYLAEDTRLERKVAIKFLPRHIAASKEDRQRFEIEAKAAAALNQSNIATIHAIEESDEEIFIVMEYIEGQELKDIIGAHRNVPLPIDDTINYARQIADGLQAAHKKGIVHRDIKSANIMITEDGKAKIMDFGLARFGEAKHHAKEQTTSGTAPYMSPEQINEDEVNQQSDIWSFGVVLYEMLTGQLPFRGEYEQAIMYSILNEAPEPISGVDPEVQRIVMKALAKNPAERYQSIDDLLSELRAIGGAHPDRQRTAMKPARLIGLITAIIAVLVVIGIFLFKPASQAVPQNKGVKTIAVLPFVDLSPKKDQQYFSDGLSEELINVLAKNPELRVTSRTSSFSFKGTNTNIKTIAAKLGVNNILEGSVRKSGNTLRITAELIDVETDATLWSDTYTGMMSNIFAVQDTISRSVAEALDATLLGKETTTQQRKTDPEAYNDYLLGKHFFDLRSRENWDRAIDYYKQALSIDPGYAPAWVGLAQTHAAQADYGYVPVDEGYRKARQEVQRALKLDPNLADAYAQLAWIEQYYDWDWSDADESYRKALELEPGNANAISGAAALEFTLGRFKEAINMVHHSIEIDPVRVAGYNNLGLFNWYAGFPYKAEAAFRKVIELNPRYPGEHVLIGRVYLVLGKPDSAMAEIMKESEPDWRIYGIALVQHSLGHNKESNTALDELIKGYQYLDAFQIAEVYGYCEETDKTFEWLERAYYQRDGGLAEIKGDPLLRNVVKDPRYTAFMKKMKLPL